MLLKVQRSGREWILAPACLDAPMEPTLLMDCQNILEYCGFWSQPNFYKQQKAHSMQLEAEWAAEKMGWEVIALHTYDMMCVEAVARRGTRTCIHLASGVHTKTNSRTRFTKAAASVSLYLHSHFYPARTATHIPHINHKRWHIIYDCFFFFIRLYPFRIFLHWTGFLS